MTKFLDVDMRAPAWTESSRGTRGEVLDARLMALPPSARASFVVADRDHEERRLDAVAGCEFVDDRIRLRE